MIPKCKHIFPLIFSMGYSCSPDHAEKMHELPDEYFKDVLPIAKRIAIAQGVPDYNILQNNGKIAHQVIYSLHP